jgi:hypothetical protein
MSFKCLCREREDGNYDVILAIQNSGLQDELDYSPELFMQDMLEKFHYLRHYETLVIKEVNIITDVLIDD